MCIATGIRRFVEGADRLQGFKERRADQSGRCEKRDANVSRITLTPLASNQGPVLAAWLTLSKRPHSAASRYRPSELTSKTRSCSR
jgi:hypothetical protein